MASDDAGEWDFYIARVDDAPASIRLDLRWREAERPRGADTLYWFALKMLDRGDHGMGTGPEAAVVGPAQEAVDASAIAIGLIPVGRMRSDGQWVASYFGPPGKEEALSAAVDAAAARAGRRHAVGSQPDASWSYYDDFLLPDEERWRWMLDRRVVESLEARGDSLTKARRVDHWAEFAESGSRDGFADAAARLGFSIAGRRGDGEGPRPHSVELHRVEPVTLEEIHSTVMELKRLAEAHDGEYDGWGTNVESEPGD